MATLEKATLSPGNTKAGERKARHFQITLNEVEKYEKLKEYLTGLKSLEYLISCQEIAPTTGHKHIHIYIQFKTPIKLSTKKLCSAHVEYCRGSPQQNINYIKKDGEILDEIGEPKLSGGIRTVKDLREADIEDIPPNYYNIKLKLEEEEKKDIDIEDLKKDVKVVYICGPSGIGKTETAKQYIREHKDIYGTKINMIKYENGFYLGVGNANIALYDDFRDNHMKASEFINFIDYNKHFLNIKGGSKINNYSLIIITSIQKLKDIYNNVREEQKEQWIRRIELINMYEESDDNDLNIDIDL